MKKRGLWDLGVATGGPGQKPDRKKWPGLSDSCMASGGLMVPKVSLQYFLLILVALPPKISIQSFWPRCDQMGQVSKFYQFSAVERPKLVKNPGGNFRNHWRKGPKSLQVKILRILPLFAPQNDRIYVLVARRSKALIGRTTVKKTDL